LFSDALDRETSTPTLTNLDGMIQELNPETTRLGWIGTGVMGRSMCGHLRKAGYSIVVYNRTQSKADDLISQGATWANSPREVASQADVVFTMVGYPSDVRETILGSDGVLKGLKAGSILIDMTSSQPSLAVEIANEATKLGIYSLDAPVSGGDIGAREARLSIMVGGDEASFERLMPLWNLMGKTIQHHGGPGAGQHCKVVNQILVGGIMVSLCESLIYAYRTGANLERIITSVASGAAGSWSLSNLGPRILKGDFQPGFYVEHFLKDLGIALDESRRMGLKLVGVEVCEQLYRSLKEQGDGRLGTQSLIRGIARLNNIPLPLTKT
jgi:3-hydroxyisobutyrate dehydrogenase